MRFSHLRKRRACFFVGTLCAGLFAAGCGRSPEATEHNPDAPAVQTSAPIPERHTTSDAQTGHAKMIFLLADIAQRAPEENFYTGSALARRYTEALNDLPDDTPDYEKAGLLTRLASEELNLGKHQEAIAHFSQAYDLMDRDATNPSQIHFLIFRMALAYLRLGVTENCYLRYQPESCIMPIQGGGVHAEEQGSRQAIKYFEEALTISPPMSTPHYGVRWLLNIAYMTLGEYPDGVPPEFLIPPEAFESKAELPRFNNISSKLGLDSFNNAGGVIVDDFDADGFLDVMTTSANPGDPMLYFKNNGNGTFSNRTAAAGLDGFLGGLNLIQADYDNDGDLDALVLRGGWFGQKGRHPNSLLQNQGHGVFTDVTFEAGLGEHHYPTQTAAWSDYDNDGDLDLFVGNEMLEGKQTELSAQLYPNDTQDRMPCQLFRNNGDGTFTDVAEYAGVLNNRFCKGVSWGDFNNDRFPDLYLSNFADKNRLYQNNGDGTFTDVAPALGLTGPSSSFPVWFWDFNNDGALDLFVSAYSAHLGHIGAYYLGETSFFEPACLYQGDGQGGFTNVAAAQNLEVPMLPMGSNFGDLNNDGYLDFYLGTGDPDYANLLPNLMFLNHGGTGFEDVTMTVGMGHLQKGHGVSFADMDNDGDLDIFEQMGGIFSGDKFNDALYENPGFGNHWISLRLQGVRSNRSAFGARIRIIIWEDGEARSIYRTVGSGGSFGCNPLAQTIGLGKADIIEKIEIFWPATGETQVFEDVGMDQAIHVVEDQEEFNLVNRATLTF